MTPPWHQLTVWLILAQCCLQNLHNADKRTFVGTNPPPIGRRTKSPQSPAGNFRFGYTQTRVNEGVRLEGHPAYNHGQITILITTRCGYPFRIDDEEEAGTEMKHDVIRVGGRQETTMKLYEIGVGDKISPSVVFSTASFAYSRSMRLLLESCTSEFAAWTTTTTTAKIGDEDSNTTRSDQTHSAIGSAKPENEMVRIFHRRVCVWAPSPSPIW